jgi:cell fate (sporulation/competence/biofilm development) regulator YmcA (YheA/YmcA/DUF963 family)
MNKFSIFFSTQLILCLTLFMVAQDSKPSFNQDQKLSLYQSRDLVNFKLSKVQALPDYAEFQKAQAAKQKADSDLDAISAKLRATPEGKDYQKALDSQQELIKSLLKGIDQSKWKLPAPEGKSTDYDFVPVENPKEKTAKK